MPCSTSDFPFLTKTLLEDIHRNEARGYYTKLNDMKNSDNPGNELDERGLLSLFGAHCDFLIFRLCEIQLGTQCLLGEHGRLSKIKA